MNLWLKSPIALRVYCPPTNHFRTLPTPNPKVITWGILTLVLSNPLSVRLISKFSPKLEVELKPRVIKIWELVEVKLACGAYENSACNSMVSKTGISKWVENLKSTPEILDLFSRMVPKEISSWYLPVSWMI